MYFDSRSLSGFLHARAIHLHYGVRPTAHAMRYDRNQIFLNYQSSDLDICVGLAVEIQIDFAALRSAAPSACLTIFDSALASVRFDFVANSAHVDSATLLI